ncbi:flavin-containing monooxygenase [Priestia megaterium]|uniref:flavin-containing monooxygenase n=1 Tax=Priestia megaterium TaxID=1404 RepID=UPI001BEB2B5B|nr:NAD(P)/FAD-dependent oxidoreductase [Priestia megaterium]MBT2255946.1 NAD(P)/FAD-dependent oxidoreductase [Priestia megaterium]MBT2281231.1 NAD(P)/FAD-dependent oxidoreductase [Priestia megaterium]
MRSIFDTIVIGSGQAGLATAYYLQKNNLNYLVLEASEQTAGSWPSYYDSLTLFSPARYSSLPGYQFPGDPERYPTKREVISYLVEYANHFDLNISTGERVTEVQKNQGVFQISTSKQNIFYAKTVVSATGDFARKCIPDIDGIDVFKRLKIHSSEYKNVEQYIDQRIVVVGGGNSAVQIAYELAKISNVTIATRRPLSFTPQRLLGKDIHFWLRITGFDYLPLEKWFSINTSVLDEGIYKQAVLNNEPERKPMFMSFTEDGVIWEDGKEEKIDTVIFATGYRPNVVFLQSLNGALDALGSPLQRKGISQTINGLYYVGLSEQRSFSSATLRGVGPDAKYVVKKIKSLKLDME